MNRLEKAILYLMDDEGYDGLSKKELCKIFYTPKMKKDVIEKVVNKLESEGLILINDNSKYFLSKNIGFKKGTIKVNKKGFGFILQEDDEDIYVSKKHLNSAMDNDEVLYKILPNKECAGVKKREAFVHSVTNRANREVVGKFVKNKNFGFVEPLINTNYDIFVPKKYLNSAKNGDIVICRITKYPENDKNPEGIIKKVIGKNRSIEIDIESEIISRNIEKEFSKEIDKALESIDVKNNLKDNNRKDFRNKLIYTIDGENSKDLDDAISVEKLENENYLIGIYIADVAEYVKENSLIDKEALKRGTSIYFNNSVIPMLPKKLSNDLCSLNQYEDKLVLALEIEINKKGKIITTNISEGIINSKYRLTYEDVNKFFAGIDMYFSQELSESLKLANEVSRILQEKRRNRGSIDFAAKEKEFFIENDKIHLKFREMGMSNKIIENFMIIANEAIAEIFELAEIPFLYRIHEEPDIEKFNSFLNVVGEYGDFIRKRKNSKIYSKDIQLIIDSIESTTQKDIISNEILKIMQKARYSNKNVGHFGLASNCYSHFTSPIRRYPDLQIHRIIKEFITGKLDLERIKHYEQILFQVALKSSLNEIKALEIERRIEDIMSCYFMNQNIGNVYNGIITSIGKKSLLIILENNIKGFLYYKSDKTIEKTLEINHKIGDCIKVSIKDIDFENLEILLNEVKN